MKPKIVVVGSSNTDMIVRLPRLPQPGETVINGSFAMAAGGKGANQAVAAARAGGNVCFVGKLGGDLFGTHALEGFDEEGIDTRFVGIDSSSPSGVALILVDARGENCIGVASGANVGFHPSDLSQAVDRIQSADVLLVQLEIPQPTIDAAISLAGQAGVRVILNPAPARKLDDVTLRNVSVLTPNESETETLCGFPLKDDEAIKSAAESLLLRGIGAVVITLGARGAFFADNRTSGFVPAFAVQPVDTTAAGDVFNGALAVSLGEHASLADAVEFANAAAALSVQKLGAQPSVPHRLEIIELLTTRASLK